SVSQLRCAIYARFSSDRQSPTSIIDQIRKCREHAGLNGWLVLENHVYCDEAVSGASTDRPGLQRLLAAVIGPTIPFDCILIDDSSRLTRRLADALNLFERLTFAGVRIVAVSRGVDLWRRSDGATGGAGGPACTVLPTAKFFVELAA